MDPRFPSKITVHRDSLSTNTGIHSLLAETYHTFIVFSFYPLLFPPKLNSKVFETQGPLKTPLAPIFTGMWAQWQNQGKTDIIIQTCISFNLQTVVKLCFPASIHFRKWVSKMAFWLFFPLRISRNTALSRMWNKLKKTLRSTVCTECTFSVWSGWNCSQQSPSYAVAALCIHGCRTALMQTELWKQGWLPNPLDFVPLINILWKRNLMKWN